MPTESPSDTNIDTFIRYPSDNSAMPPHSYVSSAPGSVLPATAPTESPPNTHIDPWHLPDKAAELPMSYISSAGPSLTTQPSRLTR